MSDAARRAEVVRDGIAGVTPSDGQVAQILARTAESTLLPLGDQLFQRLLRERIIFLGSRSTTPSPTRSAPQLLLLAAEDAERDIFLYINSPGGSVSAGMAIYDTMQFIPNDVATVAIGLAAAWASSCSAPAPGASVTPPRTRGS